MRAPGRAPKGGAFACRLSALALLVGVASCGLNQEGVAPPRDHISFPASALVAPSGDWLYVVNSNSDLRYNNGTLVAVDLTAAAKDRKETTFGLCPYADFIPPAGPGPGECCWDFLDHSILDCDERRYVEKDQTIEIGSFGAGMVFQPFDESQDEDHCGKSGYPNKQMPTGRHECLPEVDCKAPPTGAGRLFIGVRGNSSVTYLDVHFDADHVPTFGCPFDDHDGDVDACTITDSPPAAALEPQHVPDEPYALTLDNDRDFLYVGHLKGDVSHPGTGGVSLYDVQRSREQGEIVPPSLIGVTQAFFPPDVNGLFGVTSLNPRKSNGLLYATSRYGNTATSLVTTKPANDACAAPAPPDTSFMVLPAGDTFASPLVGVEIRGIAFPPDDPNRAFVLQRVPPALIGYDIADGTAGLYGNVPTDIIETCQAPTFLQQYGEHENARLYITCFESGQVYVVDPYVPRLTNVIEVGRGPAGLAFAPTVDADGKQLAYVVGFSANNISVVDLTPGSPTQFHVIQRLGFPSAVPR
jgi:DNA-binding beta-propeller fold protein YncE